MQFNLPPCRTPTGLGDTAALFGALDGLDQNGPGHTAVNVGQHDDVYSVSSTEVSEPNTAGDVTSSATSTTVSASLGLGGIAVNPPGKPDSASSATSTTFSASRAFWTSSDDKELAALFDEHGKKWKLIAPMMSGNWAYSTVKTKGRLLLKEKTKVRRML